MQSTVTVFCKNTGTYHDVPRGSSLMEISRQLNIRLRYPVVAARVNYKLEDLNFFIYMPKDVEFVDISSSAGMRCYVRTLSLVMGCAIRDLYPQCDVRIEHPISKGYYCRILCKDEQGKFHLMTLDQTMIDGIKERMRQIIAEDRPIVCEEKQTKEVMRLFKERNETELNLFETLGMPYSRYFRMGDYIDYYTGVLMPSTGYLNIFDLELYFDGMLLRIPCRKDPSRLEDTVNQEKMFGIFNEYISWNHLMKIDNVADLNVACKKNKTFDIIKLSEALQEKKISQIADMIAHREGGRPKFVLISGPSSSGKTTFSKRLTIQLRVNGITPVVISMDNYFVNREDTPKDANGEYDFEDINALDLPLFRQQLRDLLEGKEILLPTFNFEDGKRYFTGNKLKIEEDNVIILEGIHALNPNLIPDIPREATFRIYVSALTTINLDNHNWIPTTDTRLIRRIVRDYRYRGYSARETIARCPSVMRGEVKWIYPFQENADAMFNSALLFELAVLKRYAEPILAEVPKYCDEYSEAHRLEKFLSYFESIPEKEIPPTSFLREFVGGSSFRY
ncbi:MAG: nucleoside kinase [Paludibacteraceae bacterium]|nr:nucleoside kinase [Paludibacteraceae bacterium]